MNINFRAYTHSELITYICNVAPRDNTAEAELCSRVIENRFVPVEKCDNHWEHGYDVGRYDGRRDERQEITDWVIDTLTFRFGEKIDAKPMQEFIGKMVNTFPEIKPRVQPKNGAFQSKYES